jgi:uncharacterized protein YjiS (DUF1127 family)
MSMTSTVRLIRPGISRPRVHQSRSRPTPAGWLGKLLLSLERQRQRFALADLAEDKHLLSDIGLTRDQALYEANKPFWR